MQRGGVGSCSSTGLLCCVACGSRDVRVGVMCGGCGGGDGEEVVGKLFGFGGHAADGVLDAFQPCFFFLMPIRRCFVAASLRAVHSADHVQSMNAPKVPDRGTTSESCSMSSRERGARCFVVVSLVRTGMTVIFLEQLPCPCQRRHFACVCWSPYRHVTWCP